MTIPAFHAQSSLKRHYMDKAEFHQWTDAFAKGVYWDPESRRGCAVGCWSQDPQGGHAALALAMGVPEELLRLADGLFEALPEEAFRAWPARFAEAIPPGADLGGVWAQMLRWMLFDPAWGLAALGRRHGPDSVFGDVETYFDWRTEGLEVPKELEEGLGKAIEQMVQALTRWRPWDDFAREDVRAHQALNAVWLARGNGPRQLDQAAWACRAAWAAAEPYTLAQAEALLDALKEAPLSAEPRP
jgi:hypothetical protein